MRKPKGIKRPIVKSKSPGAAPKSTHPGKNLGKYLVPANLPKGTKIGAVKTVAKAIKQSTKKGMMNYE